MYMPLGVYFERKFYEKIIIDIKCFVCVFFCVVGC